MIMVDMMSIDHADLNDTKDKMVVLDQIENLEIGSISIIIFILYIKCQFVKKNILNPERIINV